MFNIESPAAFELTGTGLEWFRAFTAVEEAIGTLEDAGAALNPLIYESEWQANGVRALHELIIELKTRTAIEIGELGTRFWEIKMRATP
jgi:hypothetical protein